MYSLRQAHHHSKQSEAFCSCKYRSRWIFKTINDTFGHAAGDQVLVECAKACKKWIARFQISSLEIGEVEFLVLLPRIIEWSTCNKIRLWLNFERYVRRQLSTRHSIYLRISVGWVIHDNNYDDVDHALESGWWKNVRTEATSYVGWSERWFRI